MSLSTGLSPKAASKKKVIKTNKGKDSGTSSEEERWLDAIESGKLEEVKNIFCLIQILVHFLNTYILILNVFTSGG